MYKIASILPANIPIKMAIINMYKIILVSDTISLKLCYNISISKISNSPVVQR